MATEVMPELDEIIMKLRYAQDGVETAGFETLKEALKWDVGARSKLKAAGTAGAEFALKKAAAYGVSAANTVHVAAGAGLATTAAVAAFSGLGSVLGVWIGAAQVANAAYTSFELWDLVPKSKKGADLYPCTCGKCGDHAYWLAERHSENWAKFGASLFLIPALYTAPKAAYDKFGNAELSAFKLKMATDLRQGAKPAMSLKTIKVPKLEAAPSPNPAGQNIKAVAGPSIVAKPNVVVAQSYTLEKVPRLLTSGCRKAQALIAVLFGEYGPDRAKYRKTIAAILSDDGDKAIQGKIFL